VGYTATAGYARAVSRGAMVLAGCGLATGLLTGCLSFGPSPQQPSVNLATLPGTWVSGDGASITFTSGNEFTATNFNYGKAMPTCGTLSGSGTWRLHDSSEDYPTPAAGSPDHVLDMLFTSVSSPGRCAGGPMEMTTWDTGGKQGLCVQMDPDNPCDGYVFTKR
jgi:hypothetical protein